MRTKIVVIPAVLLALSGCSQRYEIEPLSQIQATQPEPSATLNREPSPAIAPPETEVTTEVIADADVITDPDTDPDPLPGKNPAIACDPLTGVPDDFDGSTSNGLVASLHYFTEDPSLNDPAAKSAAYYIKNGSKPNIEMYFSNVFVPPRDFTRGFVLTDGSTLKDTSGRVLEEFFGLRFRSILQLKKTGLPHHRGKYQIALLADDGAILKLQTKAGTITLNNDGDHTTRMACSRNFFVELDDESRIPLLLDYYQGPRTALSLVLAWRKFNGKRPPEEPYCGKNLGYNSFTPREHGLSAWDHLRKRGWKALEPENFLLPNERINPCERER